MNDNNPPIAVAEEFVTDAEWWPLARVHVTNVQAAVRDLLARLAQAEAERDELRKALVAANKGAQTNATINQSLAKQVLELRKAVEHLKEELADTVR